MRWPNLIVVENQGLMFGSSVIGRLECSWGQLGNPKPQYWVSVMPGLHWTHVWNRRSEDTVTYLNPQEEKESHTVCAQQCEWAWACVSSTNRCDSDLMMITLAKRHGRFVSPVISWRWHFMCDKQIVVVSWHAPICQSASCGWTLTQPRPITRRRAYHKIVMNGKL